MAGYNPEEGAPWYDYCSNITTVIIGNGVTSIGRGAFAFCTGLTSVTIYAPELTYYGSNAFDGNADGRKIYVFSDCLTAYKTGWSGYADAIVPIEGIALADAADNSALITAASGATLDVTLAGRTLTKNNEWNTLCLPFSLTAVQIDASPLAGATIKELDNTADGTSLDNGTMTLKFTTATSIEAGKPYIIKWASGSAIENPVFSGVTITSTTPTPITSNDGRVTFVGQYSPFDIVESGATGTNEGNKNEIILMSTGNKMGYSKNARTLRCFRCHFYVPVGGGEQQARSFVLDFGEGETTEIGAMLNDKGKMINDIWYDLNGRKLDGKPTKKGLYIHNGRKEVVK